jgi:hypothetical protein
LCNLVALTHPLTLCTLVPKKGTLRVSERARKAN